MLGRMSVMEKLKCIPNSYSARLYIYVYIYIINASQAKSTHKYINKKIKLLNCNANIYFNKICLSIVIIITIQYFIALKSVSPDDGSRRAVSFRVILT
jgi:p-aminobenzoyl-glutamate transporter AbgT